MKAKTLILLASSIFGVSNAAIIQLNDFEAETSAGLNMQPVESQFYGGGGDHVGTPGLGIATANPRSGTYNYVIENNTLMGNTTTTPATAHGWGGTWVGVSSLGNNGSNVTDQANAIANSTPSNPLSYVDVQAGSTFTISAWVATDATTPLTGSVTTNVRLEFIDAAGNEVFRNDNGAPLTAADLSTTYQQITHSYTLTPADIAAGVTRVTAVYGSDGHGFNNGSGLIYADDILFEVDDASFITVIPEPSSSLLALVATFGLALRRRR